MIQNKAPHYDEVLEELEEDVMTKAVGKINGNTINFKIDSSQMGYFEPPNYSNWGIDYIYYQPNFSTIKMKYVE